MADRTKAGGPRPVKPAPEHPDSSGIAPSIAAERRCLDAALSELEERARDRKNPLYAWQAILLCCGNEVPLPTWCLRYLAAVAIKFGSLASRCGVPGSTGLPVEWEFDPYLPHKASLKPSEAAKGAGWAVGLASGQGKGAFKGLVSDHRERRHEAVVAISDAAPGWLPDARATLKAQNTQIGNDGSIRRLERDARKRIKSKRSDTT